MTDSPPATRWAQAATDGVSGYSQHFAELIASGADIEGEARLADALVPRGARILDVGAGMGRVSAALLARGHDVTSIEPDPALREQAAATYPHVELLALDALQVTPDLGSFDLVVCVGNVLVYLAEDTEVTVLKRLRDVLAPGGRILAGFHLVSARRGARDYAPADVVADVEAAGLAVQQRFGSYELAPPAEDYGVWLFGRR